MTGWDRCLGFVLNGRIILYGLENAEIPQVPWLIKLSIPESERRPKSLSVAYEFPPP